MTPNKQPSLATEQAPDSESVRQPSFLKKLGTSMLNIYHHTVDFVKEKSVKVAAVGALSAVALTGCATSEAPAPTETSQSQEQQEDADLSSRIEAVLNSDSPTSEEVGALIDNTRRCLQMNN